MRIMASGYHDALNLGTDELVTIDQLVDLVSEVAGKKLTKRHNLKGPQGVRGRNSDNSLLRKVLGWEPSILLRQGLALTYPWIQQELKAVNRITDLEQVPVGS
jgi:nucleoside-diphosphate-sugar epimerase